MRALGPTAALCLAGALVGALYGCNLVRTYDKCGSAGCPGDRELTAQVQQSFAQHADLEAPNEIRVQTLDKVVYLTGMVNTPMVRELAGSLAEQVAGKGHVVNSLSLEYQGP
jgi:osmotically-inducible protein OsmY